jgi:hypothetical protein
LVKTNKVKIDEEKVRRANGIGFDPEANNKIIKHGRVKIIFNISPRLKLLSHDILSVFY